MNKHLTETINHLKTKNKILFLTTSNRRSGSHETAKSTQLANYIATQIWTKKITQIDITELHIHPCEGNVSWLSWNSCGPKESTLTDKEKNPSGCHRCRASINHPDDELRKVSKALLESEVVIFFTSVRRGQTNSIYQKLIERLTRIENRHSTLWEDNIVKNIEAGIIAMGHNWNNEQVVQTQTEVLKSFGFIVPKQLCRWWTDTDMNNESQQWYQDAVKKFEEEFGFTLQK
jgi:multimeric flavodoxin WrbA